MTTSDFSDHVNAVSPAQRLTEHDWAPSGQDRLAVSVDMPDPARFPWPAPVVMLVHGFSSHRIGRSYIFVDLGKRLIEHGVALVRFDQAGCGESTGSQLDYGLPVMLRDCESVAAWIMNQPDRFDTNRVALLGSSMGSLGAVYADAGHPSSAGLALWAPVYDLNELVVGKIDRAEIDRAIRTLGHVPYRGLTLGRTFFDAVTMEEPLDDYLRRSKSPVLIIHANEDEVVGTDHGRRFADVCQAVGRSCRFIELPSSSHDFHDHPWRNQCLEVTVEAFRQWFSLTQPAGS